MRNSYIKLNAFPKIKLHITKSFFNLVSSIISNTSDSLFNEHYVRRSFKTILCYLEKDYLNLSKICNNNITNTKHFSTPLNFFFQVKLNFFFTIICIF